jgi:RNA polymerase sigma-70 factor (ECF subfamily)
VDFQNCLQPLPGSLSQNEPIIAKWLCPYRKKEILAEPLFQKELEKHQMGECVQEKVRQLPESYQSVLVLFDLMEFRHQETAEILDISIENVKVRLHRARKKLKTILEQECRFEVDERNVLICDPVASKQ